MEEIVAVGRIYTAMRIRVEFSSEPRLLLPNVLDVGCLLSIITSLILLCRGIVNSITIILVVGCLLDLSFKLFSIIKLGAPLLTLPNLSALRRTIIPQVVHIALLCSCIYVGYVWNYEDGLNSEYIQCLESNPFEIENDVTHIIEDFGWMTPVAPKAVWVEACKATNLVMELANDIAEGNLDVESVSDIVDEYEPYVHELDSKINLLTFQTKLLVYLMLADTVLVFVMGIVRGLQKRKKQRKEILNSECQCEISG